jgi:hypothetical protein
VLLLIKMKDEEEIMLYKAKDYKFADGSGAEI